MRPKSKWSMFGPSWPASLPLKIEERKRSETDCMNNALLQLYWMRGIFHSWEKKLSNNSSLKYCSPYRHSPRSKRFQLSLARKLEREPKKIGIVLLSSQLSRWTCTETLAMQTTVDNFLITPKNMGFHECSFIHIKELSWQKRTEQTSCKIFKIFQYFFTLLVSTSFAPELSLPLDSSASLPRSRFKYRHATLLPTKTTKGKKCCLNVSSRLWGGALHDNTKNGCEGDYSSAGRRAKISNTLKYLIQNSLSSGLTASFSTIEMISIVLTHQRHHHPWLKLL